MMRTWRSRLLVATALAALIGATVSVFAAETIDPNNDNSQFAWGENVGWINAEPSGNNGPGVTVSGTKLTGYMYGENIGWINLNCQNNNTCGSTGNYGVTNDGQGNLAGYAWGENVGWISFSCKNNQPSCASTGDYGVVINKTTGDFSGYAYGENIGWISFSCSNKNTCGSAQYKVTTDDGDGVPGATDTCPFDADPTNKNTDGNLIDLSGSGKAFNDRTVANSDENGDVCDTDDDNDGFLDTVEPQLGPAGTQHGLCPSATGPLDPLKADTDGDRTLDKAECLFGTDPNDPNSKPAAIVAPDADSDGLPDAIETALGTNPNNPDSDGDGVLDGVEVRGYNTNPLATNTDGDACGDAKEIASINGDQAVNSTDLSQIAQAFSFTSSSPAYILDFDMNKNGAINSVDLLFAASHFGSCP